VTDLFGWSAAVRWTEKSSVVAIGAVGTSGDGTSGTVYFYNVPKPGVD
jgi:hypothetical protein